MPVAMEQTGHIQAKHAARGLLIIGALALAADPAAWLLRSWTDPGYGSDGWAVFALSLAIAAWSWSSPLADPVPVPGSPFALLLGTAAIRAVGQVLDIDTISALALSVDVYALARLARLDRRVRAVAPVGLAALFACSLPLTRLIERLVGQPMQEISASGACSLLRLAFDDVACTGTQIILAGRPIMVDLPCAGIAGLTLLATALILAATLLRPTPLRLAAAAVTALVAILAGNAVRVALLSAGAAFAPVDVLAEPLHSAIGLATLALAALPPLAILKAGPAHHPTSGRPTRHVPLPLAILFAAAAGTVLLLPSSPIDASVTPITVTLPSRIDAYQLLEQPLSDPERRYFATYGGGAAKGLYGPMGLLATRTTSPLRHLHEPTDCLRGMGFTVVFLGTTTAPVAASIYRLTGPDGRVWTAYATFTADDGTIVPTVAAAIAHWFTHPGTTWTALQRITPADLPDHQRASLDAALFATLDIQQEPTR